MDKRLARIQSEVALAAVRFSHTHSAEFDDEADSWVIIKDFPLPSGYNYPTTDILMLLHSNYPQTPPDWFYVDDNLKLADGRRPSHMFYQSTTHDPNVRRANCVMDTPPQMKGWTGCCLHIRTWKPAANPLDGHSLLSVCALIEGALKRWRNPSNPF